jgi:hypothetical protein
MTPQEKAFHLYFSFIRDVTSDTKRAKIAALKVVDELIRNSFPGVIECYWQEVKQEIIKLKV